MESAYLILLKASILLTVSLSGTIWHGTARFHDTESGTDGISIRAAIVPPSCRHRAAIVPIRAAQLCRIVPLYKSINFY